MAVQVERAWEPSVKATVPIKSFLLPSFRRILVALRIQWRNSTPRFTLTPQQELKILNISFPQDRFQPTTSR